MKTKEKTRQHSVGAVLAVWMAVVVFLTAACGTGEGAGKVKIPLLSGKEETVVSEETKRTIEAFAEENGLDPEQWPQSLVVMLERNPEAKEFVLNYPLKKDAEPVICLEEYENTGEVPLFLQWDERWGYRQYGKEVMGLSGCGPTCLSMVCVYLLKDAAYHPEYLAEFAEENGYCVPGSGSAWALIPEGGRKLGLEVTELPLDENRILGHLQAGDPIICVMGPGDFTTTGHFIVLTGLEDGRIKVNDPNSVLRSQQLWEYETIQSQIRNLWVLS